MEDELQRRDRFSGKGAQEGVTLGQEDREERSVPLLDKGQRHPYIPSSLFILL